MSSNRKSGYRFKAPPPVGAYPYAKRVGNLLFLSGIGPRDADTDEVPGLKQDEDGNTISYDIEAECHSVFENVRCILEGSGSRWENMVDVTVFLTNMKGDFKKFNALYEEYFDNVRPSRTTVEIKSLPTPIHIELKVIAVAD